MLEVFDLLADCLDFAAVSAGKRRVEPRLGRVVTIAQELPQIFVAAALGLRRFALFAVQER